MQFFQWDETFQTGSPLVDEQHQQLVDIVNRFGDLLAHNATGRQEVETVCQELLEYTRYHFDAEERLMASLGLDQRHHQQHQQQHMDLLNEINPLRQHLVSENYALGKNTFEFLINWLVFHILGTDMLMARQIAAIKQGKTAAEAYADEEQDNQNSTGLLLKAVKKLLYQISSRNTQLVELNETLEHKVEERTRELSEANQRLKELASTDVLTGVLNRRAFMEEANSMFDLAKRYQRPLSLLMIDADHFKRVNDTHGHQAGDLVLVRLSNAMRNCLRGTDIFGRIGGEEFAVILPETDLQKTAELTERLLRTVRNMAIAVEPAVVLTITVSIGVATIPPVDSSLDVLIKQADAALYRAKAEGRDRCCGAA